MIDIHCLMADLSKHRPIFHSEADFQFALAWRIHEVMSDCKIRLEWPYRKAKYWHLDIWLSIPRIAIELKYRTQKLEWEYDGEHFSLGSRGRHGGYGFLDDIQKLERVVKDGKAKSGVAVLLTNDPSNWKPPSQQGTKDTNVRLHELDWKEYSSFGEGTYQQFRYLAVSVK